MTLVSVCVHFLKLLDTQTQKWTQSLTKKIADDNIAVYFYIIITNQITGGSVSWSTIINPMHKIDQISWPMIGQTSSF